MDPTIFPANQAFNPPFGGGSPAPTFINVKVGSQAFPPAPLVQPFPAEPTPPLLPTLPALVGVPPVAVKFVMVPPAIEIDPAEQVLQPLDVPNFAVADFGSYVSNANATDALATYTVASVLDNDTGLPPILTPPPLTPPQTAAVNLLVTLVPTGKTLFGYGVSLAGRAAQFQVTPSAAARIISANAADSITVPNTNFIPVVGDTAVVAGVPYLVVSVVDAATGFYPTPASLNLIVSLVTKLAPAGQSPGFTPGNKIGQTAQFFVAVVIAKRPIMVYGDYSVVISVADAQGVNFLPAIGDVMSVDVARYNAELVAQLTGQTQNVVPTTQPLLQGCLVPPGSFPIIIPSDSVQSSGLPVQDVVATDQQTAIGTPVNYKPGISLSNASGTTQDVLIR
jgi:hypothetical protein